MKGLDIQKETDKSKQLTLDASEYADRKEYMDAYLSQCMATYEALKAVKKMQIWLQENLGGGVAK